MLRSGARIAMDRLFNDLDLDSDGMLTRAELRQAASDLGWHWREAPLYAVLDLLTLCGPLSRDAFNEYMETIVRDFRGPFGRILESVPYSFATADFDGAQADATDNEEVEESQVALDEQQTAEETTIDMAELLKTSGSDEAKKDYQSLISQYCEGSCAIPGDKAALLIIDPQRSFTEGAWMQSIGAEGEREVQPIGQAFKNCAAALSKYYGRLETMFTRCPFPPDSYDWNRHVSKIISPSQIYFIKPGNSVLWPPTNGFDKWVNALISQGKNGLVMGGCTLNSCVRVSAIETYERFHHLGLEVFVDLSLSAARIGNYKRSSFFGGRSSVETAVREMLEAGVRIVSKTVYI